MDLKEYQHEVIVTERGCHLNFFLLKGKRETI